MDLAEANYFSPCRYSAFHAIYNLNSRTWHIYLRQIFSLNYIPYFFFSLLESISRQLFCDLCDGLKQFLLFFALKYLKNFLRKANFFLSEKHIWDFKGNKYFFAKTSSIRGSLLAEHLYDWSGLIKLNLKLNIFVFVLFVVERGLSVKRNFLLRVMICCWRRNDNTEIRRTWWCSSVVPSLTYSFLDVIFKSSETFLSSIEPIFRRHTLSSYDFTLHPQLREFFLRAISTNEHFQWTRAPCMIRRNEKKRGKTTRYQRRKEKTLTRLGDFGFHSKKFFIRQNFENLIFSINDFALKLEFHSFLWNLLR